MAAPPQAGVAIPVIDLSPLRAPEPDAAALAALGTAVSSACSRVGFFNVVGHGLSEADVAGLLRLARRLFDLPQAAKNALDASQSLLARG